MALSLWHSDGPRRIFRERYARITNECIAIQHLAINHHPGGIEYLPFEKDISIFDAPCRILGAGSRCPKGVSLSKAKDS